MLSSRRNSMWRVFNHQLLMAFLALVGLNHAEEPLPPPPIIPTAYPVVRYEGGWNKNPFTLKTVPVVEEQESFAKDLAIGAYYGDAKDPTVVVVNTKTGERTRLKKNQPAANGIQMTSVRLSSSRKDVVAELSLGAQKAEVRFDSDYLKQITSVDAARASNGKPNAANGQRPGAPPPANHPPTPPKPMQAVNQVKPAAGPQQIPRTQDRNIPSVANSQAADKSNPLASVPIVQKSAAIPRRSLLKTLPNQ
jgi:hypothetical protein